MIQGGCVAVVAASPPSGREVINSSELLITIVTKVTIVTIVTIALRHYVTRGINFTVADNSYYQTSDNFVSVSVSCTMF